MATTNNSDDCACGHILDVSTDQLCRHCARGPQQRLERLASRTLGHGEMCPCRACVAVRAL